MSLVRSGYPRDWPADASVGRGRRSSSGGFSRFLVAVGVGVGGTLAWQAYGDQARELIARTYPQLHWVAPHPGAPQTASTIIAPGAVPGRSTDQQLQELSLGLAAMRQRVEQLSQQLAASQDQLTRDITAKMQTAERDILDKIGTGQPPPRPDVTASRKPPTAAQLH